MQLPKMKERPLISKGEHILTLKGVEVKRIESKYPDGKSEDNKADVLIWTFISRTKSDDGFREEVEVLTAPHIGANNNTKKLLRQMLPDLEDEEIEGTDTDELEGRKFRGRIVHVERNGKQRAEFAMLEPYTGGANGNGKKDKEPDDYFADD